MQAKPVSKTKKTRVKKDGSIVELVAPDGGWGYMVGLALIIFYVTSSGSLPAFGLIYNDFLSSIGEGAKGVTIMQSAMSVTVSLSAVVTTIALKRYSLRQVGMAGAFVAFLSTFLSIFVTTIYEVIIYGAFQAGAFGVVMPIIYTSFNSYFVEKRVFVMSLCKGIVGIILMIYPIFVAYLMETFGFRGCLAILCGFGANAFVAMIMLQPVENHLKEKPITYHTYENSKDSTIQINIVDTDGVPEVNGKVIIKINGEILKDEDEEDRALKDLLLPSTPERRLSVPLLKLNTENRRQSMPTNDVRNRIFERMDTVEKQNISEYIKATSMLSIGSFDGTVISPSPQIANKKGKLRSLLNFEDMSLLKDGTFLNICVGLTFCLFSDGMFTMLLPMMLFSNHFNTDQVAVILAAFAAGDMATRFLLAFISHWFKIKPRYIFFTGAVMAFILRIVLNFFSRFNAVMLIVVLLGTTKCLTHLTVPLILADRVSIDRYPGAFSIYILMYAAVNLTLAPIVGIIRDATDSYNVAFYILTAAFLVCIVPWTIEFITLHRQAKQIRVNTTL